MLAACYLDRFSSIVGFTRSNGLEVRVECYRSVRPDRPLYAGNGEISRSCHVVNVFHRQDYGMPDRAGQPGQVRPVQHRFFYAHCRRALLARRKELRPFKALRTLHMAYFGRDVSIELAITPRAAKDAAWRSARDESAMAHRLGRQGRAFRTRALQRAESIFANVPTRARDGTGRDFGFGAVFRACQVAVHLLHRSAQRLRPSFVGFAVMIAVATPTRGVFLCSMARSFSARGQQQAHCHPIRISLARVNCT